MGSPEDRILSYHDIVLRRQDLDLIAAPHWLNDQVIAFFFEYLSREVYADRPDILLIPGAATFLLLTVGPDVAPAILDPLNFSSRSLTLFAVNNNPDGAVAGGGSHWSLCAYTRADNTLRYLDSHFGGNEAASRALHAALAPALPPGARLTQAPCPPQQNGYDCGMAVLALARVICERFAAVQDGGGTLSFEVAPEAVAAATLDAARAELRALIVSKCEAEKGALHR